MRCGGIFLGITHLALNTCQHLSMVAQRLCQDDDAGRLVGNVDGF